MRKDENSDVIKIKCKEDLPKIFIYYLYNMTCLECLNVTSIVDDRCAELTNSYPYLSDAAPISNSQHLSNLDIDVEIPSDSNFKYYSTHDFHSDYDISDIMLFSIALQY